MEVGGSNTNGPSKELVLSRLLKAHEGYFDVQRTWQHAGRTFAGFAEFHTYGEQYVLSKKAKLWEVASHEYMLFDVRDVLDQPAAAELVEFMQTRGLELVHPEPNHMNSNLTLVVIASEVTPEAAKLFRKTRFRKNFKLGLQGWSDLRLACIDVNAGTVVANGAAKPLRKTLQANIGPEKTDGKE